MAYTPAYNPTFGELGASVPQRWPEAAIIEAKAKGKDTLGLALSGGGYRSAIFNYGVLRGLRDIGALATVDYLSVVSGGSWIGTPFAMAEALDRFFYFADSQSNFVEEGFESLLPNPVRVAEEAALSREESNGMSNIYGRLLAKTFLREHGDLSRWQPLSDASLIQDADRPFLIVNGTVNFRRPGSFHVTQECFEMTRLYCGSRSLGYTETQALKAVERPIRIRDAIAISGAAVAVHIPGLGAEVLGLGLSREIDNYTRGEPVAPADAPRSDRLDVADGGHYNNLGVESLVNRGCGYLIVVDAEHDPEARRGTRSNQAYSGLKKLLSRIHIPLPKVTVQKLDRADEAVHEIRGDAKTPDILYIKLKSSRDFDRVAAKKPYNQPGLLRNLFARGKFCFDPQFSTAKLDYSFAEHRNLSELGGFVVHQYADVIRRFCQRSTS